MKVLNIVESDNINYNVKDYKFDEGIQVSTLLPILRQFETETIKMKVCHCDTFDAEGNPLYYRYDTIDDIANIVNSPSPYIKFGAEYYDTQTSSYCFALIANVNSDVVRYLVDKKK